MTDKPKSAIEEAEKAMEQAGTKHQGKFINPWQRSEPTNEQEKTR